MLVQCDWSAPEYVAGIQGLAEEIELPAGSVTHIPVVIRYIDAGEAQVGAVLLMHD